MRLAPGRLPPGSPGQAGLPGKTWLELIALAADEEAGDWRGPVLWWAKRRVGPAELVSFVQAELVRTPSSAIAGRRMILLLRLAGYAAAALLDSDARDVVSTALTFSRKAVDPYGDSGLTLIARSAVTVLLEQRPEFDDILTRALELQACEGEDAARAAAACRGTAPCVRGSETDRVTSARRWSERRPAPASGPSRCRPPRALPMHSSHGRPVSAAPRRHGGRRSWPCSAAARFLPGSRPGDRRHCGWGGDAPAADGAPAPATVSLGDSIALLTLLAAAYVFTVQLSASRPPGASPAPRGTRGSCPGATRPP